MNEIMKTIYRFYNLTASRFDCDVVNSPPKVSSYCLDPDLTPSRYNTSGPSRFVVTSDGLGVHKGWRRKTPHSQFLLARHVIIFLSTSFAISDAVTFRLWRRHSLLPAWILKTLLFSSLLAPKTSKMLLFPDFHFKEPKMTKGTI